MKKDRKYFLKWQDELDELEAKYGSQTKESVSILEDNLAAMLFLCTTVCGVDIARVLVKMDSESKYMHKLITGKEPAKKPKN